LRELVVWAAREPATVSVRKETAVIRFIVTLQY
jgi:hypothetical protein